MTQAVAEWVEFLDDLLQRPDESREAWQERTGGRGSRTRSRRSATVVTPSPSADRSRLTPSYGKAYDQGVGRGSPTRRTTMAHNATRTEHAGPKRGRGAYWGRKKDAKRQSKKARRRNDRAEARA